MRCPSSLRTLEASAILLFFVQAVRVLFSVLFGLIYDFIFAERLAFGTLAVVMLFVFAAFLSPLAVPRRSFRRLLFGSALVVALARIPMSINLPAVRLWSSILIVAAGGLYIAVLLRQRPRTFSTGLVLAFAVDQILRAAGNTFDWGLRDWWLPVQVLLSLATCAVAWQAFLRFEGEHSVGEHIGIAGGLAVGALLFLETSLLGSPNALARWSGVGYAVVAPLLLLVTLLAVFSPVRRMALRLLQGPIGGLGLLFLALAGLAAGRSVGGGVGLAGMLVARFLLLLASFRLARPRRRGRTGVALAFGNFLFLVVNFAFAFSFTYADTIPAFRGMGLPIVLVAAAVAGFPALQPVSVKPETWDLKPRPYHWAVAAVAVLLVAAFAWPPALDLKHSGPIRVGTYNIHYGYNTPWQLSLEAQARTIEESGADVVMLQEVDTGRVTSYGVDDLLWLARRLRMQESYGPALEGLSGVALLSRFPITVVDTQWLTSGLEQTAIVHARVQVGERTLDAYGAWLGLESEERGRQLDDALATIGDASPCVFGADFNSTPDSPIYARIHAEGFEDPFVVGGFDPVPTDPAIEPVKRIDFVWARGLDVRDAHVLDSLASDHRMVVVELALP